MTTIDDDGDCDYDYGHATMSVEPDPLAPPSTPSASALDETALAPSVLRRRARLGVVLLLGRTVVLQFAVLGGNVVLARLLDPRDFGVFAIVQFALSFFLFFGDAGLGGALVQKKVSPSQRELSSVFFLQLGLALAIMAIVGLGAGGIRLIWSDLPAGSVWLLRALSVGLLLTVLRVVPAILMERELLFGRLAALEVVTSLSFYVVAVVFALLDFGVWALVAGTLFQGVIATALALAMRPWRPSWHFDTKLLRPIIAFGIPFQIKNIIGFINGAIAPVYAGAALGARAVGFINFAQNTAYFPLKLVEVMSRVTFPLYSRLQDDKKLFADTLGRSIQICAIGTFFFVGLFMGMGEQVIRVVFTDKWLPALPLLHIYTAAISIGFVSPIVGAALDASGRPQIFARLAFGWTLLNWTVVLITTPRWGMVGFAAGYSVHVVVGNVAVLIIMVYLIPGVRTFRRVVAPVVAGGGIWALAHFIGPYATGVLTFIGVVVACTLAYASLLMILDWRGVKEAVALVPRPGADSPYAEKLPADEELPPAASAADEGEGTNGG